MRLGRVQEVGELMALSGETTEENDAGHAEEVGN